MTFDLQAFSGTISDIRRDLDLLDKAVSWLAPTAYEQRTGAGGGAQAPCDVCGHPCQCPGRNGCHGVGRVRGRECDECVVAVLGDVGEIVIRRRTVTDSLDAAAREVDRMWDTTKGLSTRAAKLANLIDRGASRLPGMEPPSVDPREVLAQVLRRDQRVARGEDLPAMPTVAESAKKLLADKAKQQQRIDEARAKREREAGDTKVRNKWRGRR